MTKGSTPSVSTPPAPQPHRNDAEYARKLALAILSTLESKGLLSKLDVEAILHVAHRTAVAAPAPDLSPVTPVAENTVTQSKTEDQPSYKSKDRPTDPVAASSEQPAAASDDATPKTVMPETEEQPEKTALQTGSHEQTGDDEAAAPRRPLGPAVLGTRWVKPDTVTPEAATRDSTDRLAHEPDAVKVTGQAQAAPARNRPLAPAILTGKPQTGPDATWTEPTGTETAEPQRSKDEVKSSVQENLEASQDKAEAQSNRTPLEKENLKDRDNDTALVIDLNLD